jgi:hypothetical protein
MKFTPEDFEYCFDDLAGELDPDKCAAVANAKLEVLLEQLKIMEEALRVCSSTGSPTAQKALRICVELEKKQK